MPTPRSESYTADTGTDVYAGYSPGSLIIGNARIAIWGQSNALGRANRSDIGDPPLSSDPGLAVYDAGTFDRVYIWTGSAYTKLQPSVNNGAAAGQFGSEFGLAVRWMRETTEGNLYLEKWAESGLSITSNYFSPGVWPYTTAISNRGTANTWLTGQGITLSSDSWLWVQGESDSGMSQATYESHLNNLITGLTTDGVLFPSSQRLLVQMATGTAGYGAGPVAAKTAVAAANPSNTQTLNAPAYMKPDNLHQNGRGQVQLGYDSFEKLFDAVHINT